MRTSASLSLYILEQYQTSPLKKEPKRNFFYLTDVTLVVADIKSERLIKRTCLQQDLFDMTMVTMVLDTKSSESESFKCRGVYDDTCFVHGMARNL